MRIKIIIGLLLLQLCSEAFTAEMYKERRNRLAEQMGDNSILVLFSDTAKNRNGDVNWPFRQDDNLHYLTGDTYPDTSLVVIKSAGKVSSILFAKLGDPHYETWEGKLPSKEQREKETGVDRVFKAEQFDTTIFRLINGRSLKTKREDWFGTPEYLPIYHALTKGELEVWLDLGRYRSLDARQTHGRAETFAQKIANAFPEVSLNNIAPVIHAARRIKTASELELMRRAIDITGEAQLAAMKRSLTAEYEYQVQATLEFTFRDLGACCRAFPSIVAGGENATILHYGKNNDKLDTNGLLLVDIGAEYHYYAADVTRTFPVSGKFSDEQKHIYELVLSAQRAAIKQAKEGVTNRQLADLTDKILGAGLLELGLITKANSEQVSSYVLHSLGHTLGLNTHDVDESYMELEEGMVITVEPGIYVRANDVKGKPWFQGLDDQERQQVENALKKYKGIGVRIEDDILIGRRSSEILSDNSPVTVEEIEAMMARWKN